MAEERRGPGLTGQRRNTMRMRTWLVLVLMVALAALALLTPAWAAEAPKDFKSLVGQAVGGLIPLYVPLLLIGLKKAL